MSSRKLAYKYIRHELHVHNTCHWVMGMVHELILQRGPKFRVGCIPFLQRFLWLRISIFYFNLIPPSQSVRLA